MPNVDDKCSFEADKTSEKYKKEEKKDVPLHKSLKTTTETSTFFFLSKFKQNDVSHQERLPKNFKDLENLLNKILISLEETENVFMNQAKAVMERDLTLINWRMRLMNLQKTLKEKKRDFERIDQTVQCFVKLSCHIDSILSKLEKDLPGPSFVCNAFKYTPARMAMYDTMMKIDINQREMLQQISSAAFSINEVSESNPSDPVDQFTKILSLHVEILKTIERRVGILEEQLKVVRALHKFYKHKKKTVIYDYWC